MSKFRYEASDQNGKIVKGVIEASSTEDAIEKIHGKDCYPTRVKQIKERGKAVGGKKKKGGINLNITIGGVKPKLVNQFTRQLSTLQDAGVPIVQSINILHQQMKKGLFKNILEEMESEIQGGDGLSVAMSKHPKAFDKLYVNVINAGEVGGALDIVLRRLAEYREKMQKLKAKIIGSMMYPVSVIIIALAIVSGIIMFIIPKFAVMFDEMEITLPFITLALVNLSDFMIHRWYAIFGIPVVIIVFYKLINKIDSVRLVVDRLKFKIPVFGPIINKAVVSKVVRTLSTLTSSGVPILEALNNVRDVAGNLAMTRAVEHMHDSIREGESIAKPLREAKVCDMMVVNMVEIGEQSGELDKMLSKVADNYDDEIDTAVDAMVSLIEPLMIVGLGGAVGTIVVALFMPLIKLMQTL